MGGLAETYRTDGYGQALAGTGQTLITEGARNPFRFRGAHNLGTDEEPLYRMGARVYAPSAGAFTSLDSYAGSAADPASMNRFLYVEGNPTSFIDPTGHYTQGGQTCDPRYDDCGYRDPGEQVGQTKKAKAKAANPYANVYKPVAKAPVYTAPPPTAPSGCSVTGDCQSTEPNWWTPMGYSSAEGAVCALYAMHSVGIPDWCVGREKEIDEAFNRACANGSTSAIYCALPDVRPMPCGESCKVVKIELVSFVDPTGISNAYLAFHYCGHGDAANCAVNSVAMIPVVGLGIKDVGKGVKLGAEAAKLLSPEELAELARMIKNVGDVHPAQLSQQVIAVGTNADGVLVGASNTSSSWTQGQRALADQLGITRAPSRTVQGDALHAEENMLGLLSDANGVGLSALPPCLDRCQEILGALGIPWAVSK